MAAGWRAHAERVRGTSRYGNGCARRSAGRSGYVLRRALIGCLVALMPAAPAGAGTIVVKLGLAPGKLSVASTHPSVAAGGTVSVTVKVADGRGSGKGWTLRFANARGLAVTSITARCASNSTCTLPAAVGTPAGGTVLQAAHDTGMGIIQLAVTVHASQAARIGFTVS